MGCGCIKTAIKGATGLASAAAVASGLAPDLASGHNTTQLRRSTCKACPEITLVNGKIGNLSRCKLCGCFVMAKTLLIDEHCPLDSW